MVKTPEFEERMMFGATSEKRPIATPESIHITPGAVVDLRYKGKTASIRVTKVLQPQTEFEGEIEAFEHEPEHAGLEQGDVVRFAGKGSEAVQSVRSSGSGNDRRIGECQCLAR